MKVIVFVFLTLVSVMAQGNGGFDFSNPPAYFGGNREPEIIEYKMILTKIKRAKADLAITGNLNVRSNGQVTSFNINGKKFSTEEIKVSEFFNIELNGEFVSAVILKDDLKARYKIRFVFGSFNGMVLYFAEDSVSQTLTQQEIHDNTIQNGFNFDN